jgi:hypothetical protein
MTHDHADAFPIQIGNALLKLIALQVEGAGKISLHAEDSVSHEPNPASTRRSFGDVGRSLEFGLEEIFAKRRRFFHGLPVHRAHRFLEMAELLVVAEKDDGGDSGPDEAVPARPTRAGPDIEDSNADVPREKQSANTSFGEQ